MVNGWRLMVIKMSNIIKNVYTSGEQRVMLAQFMDSKPHLVSGQFSAAFTFKSAQNEWQEIAEILNAIPGATKDWKHWRKTWQDMRSKAKSKKAAQCSYMGRTGGGKASPKILDEVDNTIINMIEPTVTTGIDVPESVVTITLDEYSYAAKSSPASDEIAARSSPAAACLSTALPALAPAAAVAGSSSVTAVTSTPAFTSTPKFTANENKKVKQKLFSHGVKATSSAKRLDNAIACSNSFQDVAERKLLIKEEYYKKKLALYKRDIRAKEHFRKELLVLQMRKTIAQENIASALKSNKLP